MGFEDTEGRTIPKQTFFNLSVEKQAVLIAAVKQEFSRVPLNEASIANIVKNAGIPRGSFYQYFEDKEDAFYYLLEQQTKKNNSEFIRTLKNNDGDIFDAFLQTFRKMVGRFQEQQDRDFFRNAFLNMNYKMETKLTKGFEINKDDLDKQFLDVVTFINMEKLNITDEEELNHVVQIIMAVTIRNLMNNFAKRYTFEEAIQNYEQEIKLLKKGLYKEDTRS